MYVRWKVLIGLGTVFWVSLCCFDMFFMDPITKTYCLNSDVTENLYQTFKKPVVKKAKPIESKTWFDFAKTMVVWNCSAFAVTIAMCFVGRASLNYLSNLQLKFLKRGVMVQLSEAPQLPSTENRAKKDVPNSKIPVPTYSKVMLPDSKDDLLFESSGTVLTNSSTSVETAVRPKSEICPRTEQQMERQCAKLRDEMLTLQANSLKEHAALSRKLEFVLKEKRDLYRQLMVIQKENRAAKEQLEELLSERTLLVKRLECASKEFKLNIKSKKEALRNLEESQTTITTLQRQLERVTQEREALQTRLKGLMEEHRLLRERLAKYEAEEIVQTASNDSERNTSISTPICTMQSSKRVVSELSKNFENLTEISQSQKDVQKVQERLLNLEKSLDNLKFVSWEQVGRKSSRSTLNTNAENLDDQRPREQKDFDMEFNNFLSSIATEAEPPLEDSLREKSIEKNFFDADNLTDEQRRRILKPTISEDETSCTSKNFDGFIESDTDPFERMSSLANLVRLPTPPRRHRYREAGDSENETSTTSKNEEEERRKIHKSRISNSPAFQKFLKKLDPLDRNQRLADSVLQTVF